MQDPIPIATAEDYLLRAMAGDPGAEPLSHELAASVLALVDRRRGALPVIAHTHPIVRGALAVYHRKSALQFLRVSSFAAELSRIADELKLDVLVVKGLALALACYPNPVDRRMGDLDVVIRPEHLDRFETAVAELGYGWERNCPPEFNVYDFQAPYGHPTSPSLPFLDIHWGFESHNYGLLTPDALFRTAQAAPLNHLRAILTPAPVEHMVFLCCHMFKEWCSREERKPSQLIDLQRMADRYPEVLSEVLPLAARRRCATQVSWALLMVSALSPSIGAAAGLDPDVVHSDALQAYFRAWFFRHPLTERAVAFEASVLADPQRPPPSAEVGARTASWPGAGATPGALERFAREHATLVIVDRAGAPRCHLALAVADDGLHGVAAVRVDEWQPGAVVPNSLELSVLHPGVHADRTSLALRADLVRPRFGRRDEMWPYPPERPDAIVEVGPSRVEVTGDRTYAASFVCPWDELGGRPGSATALRLEAAVMEPVALGAVSPQQLRRHPGARWYGWAAPHRLIWHGVLPSEMGSLRIRT